MQGNDRLGAVCLITILSFSAWAEAAPVSTGSLLEEMTDLARLARWPDPAYRTVQFSSYDRRSTTSEAPGWFSNADGFGGEPIPAFLKVLREPQGDQPGLYLLAEAAGPGAIVRGWSAGMGGVLRVYLDPPAEGNGQPVWEGPAYDFLAHRSEAYMKSAGVDLQPGDALSQEDADYLPVPFARGLRVTWEGKLGDLHFYHLQIRCYPEGTAVQTFDPKKDLREWERELHAAIAGLSRPSPNYIGNEIKLDAILGPGRSWTWSTPTNGPGAVRELRLRSSAGAPDTALRGCLLRISFDGSQRPQVEAPVGDFFGSGPGVNPFSSLPFTVSADGTMICRFVMPYEKSVRLEIVNYTKDPVHYDGSVLLSPWQWDERSLYFRAKWRADHNLLAGAGALDLPYVLTMGKGVFAGCAAMIMNPSGVPTAGGNWWGEGDEKVMLDGEEKPSTFGTGSEDYFNYSWSRPDLFAHPYCGQPLDSGPDTSGYISNHRFQVMDALPFEKSLAFLMELWAHNRTPGLSYARIAYHYARPNAIDDHRALMPADLVIPPLPKREPKMLGGASGARFYLPDQLRLNVSTGRVETVPFPLATQLEVAQWNADPGGKLSFTLAFEKAQRASIHLVAVHRPEGATVRMLVNGKPASTGEGVEEVELRSAHAPRDLNVNFKPVELNAGRNEIVLECVKPGLVALDYVWVKPEKGGE